MPWPRSPQRYCETDEDDSYPLNFAFECLFEDCKQVLDPNDHAILTAHLDQHAKEGITKAEFVSIATKAGFLSRIRGGMRCVIPNCEVVNKTTMVEHIMKYHSGSGTGEFNQEEDSAKLLLAIAESVVALCQTSELFQDAMKGCRQGEKTVVSFTSPPKVQLSFVHTKIEHIKTNGLDSLFGNIVPVVRGVENQRVSGGGTVLNAVDQQKDHQRHGSPQQQLTDTQNRPPMQDAENRLNLLLRARKNDTAKCNRFTATIERHRSLFKKKSPPQQQNRQQAGRLHVGGLEKGQVEQNKSPSASWQTVEEIGRCDAPWDTFGDEVARLNHNVEIEEVDANFSDVDDERLTEAELADHTRVEGYGNEQSFEEQLFDEEIDDAFDLQLSTNLLETCILHIDELSPVISNPSGGWFHVPTGFNSDYSVRVASPSFAILLSFFYCHKKCLVCGGGLSTDNAAMNHANTYCGFCVLDIAKLLDILPKEYCGDDETPAPATSTSSSQVFNAGIYKPIFMEHSKFLCPDEVCNMKLDTYVGILAHVLIFHRELMAPPGNPDLPTFV